MRRRQRGRHEWRIGVSVCYRRLWLVDRSRSAMYDGASPCSALYFSRNSLNWTRRGTGSQWRHIDGSKLHHLAYRCHRPFKFIGHKCLPEKNTHSQLQLTTATNIGKERSQKVIFHSCAENHPQIYSKQDFQILRGGSTFGISCWL